MIPAKQVFNNSLPVKTSYVKILREFLDLTEQQGPNEMTLTAQVSDATLSSVAYSGG